MVKIDGRDVRDYAVDPLREQIGYVLQDTVLFRGTISKTSPLEGRTPPAKKLSTLRELANADEFISRMPKGYDTPWASADRRSPADSASVWVSRA